MIINQNTPEIMLFRKGCSNATITFTKHRINFSLGANTKFNLKAGMYATFDYRNKQLFIIINNDSSGFLISLYHKHREFLKIESKPLVTLLQNKIGFKCPAKFYMQPCSYNVNLIEILIAKTVNEIGKN